MTDPQTSESLPRSRLRLRSASLVQTIFAPAPRVSLSAWSDQHRELLREMGAVEPGRWVTDRVPYLRKPMDALTDPLGPRRVVFMKASQTGGSEIGHNWILYTIHQDPQPFLFLMPTDGVLKNWSTTKLEPLLEHHDVLRSRLVESGGRRDAGDTMTRKKFRGGYFLGLSGRSSANLRSTVAAYAMADELDELLPDLSKQGDPLSILERAQRTFLDAGAKLYLVSTPTEEGFSRIEGEYEASDQEHYFVPCPSCHARQTFRFRGTDASESWDDREAGIHRLICDRDAAGDLVPASARYLCEYCGVLLPEAEKDRMLRQGTWVPLRPSVTETLGFHIEAVASPLVSWRSVVAAFMESRRNAATLKTFVNLWRGLPFATKGTVLEPSVLSQRAESYLAEVPAGVGLLTGFIDVQGDRLETLVVGWGALIESWVIAWDQWDGDPGQRAIWDRVDQEWVHRVWGHASGARLQLAAFGVDAGYQAEAVHAFCDRFDSTVCIPTVGRAGRGGPLLVSPDRLKYKRSRERHRRTWMINVDAGKDQLASRLHLIPQVARPVPEAVHYPDTLPEVFFDQLTSEKRVTVYVRGRPTQEWRLRPNRRNEALDGMIGCMAALAHLGPNVTRRLAEIVQEVTAHGMSANPHAEQPERGTVSHPLRSSGGRRMRSGGIT